MVLNSFVYIGEGFPAPTVHQHARSCTPVTPKTSILQQSDNFEVAQISDDVLCSLADGNPSSAHLNPNQTYCRNKSVAATPTSALGK